MDVWLDHAINENWKLNVHDSFSYGRSPDLTNPGDGTIYRIQGDNMVNHAHISLDTQWTKLFGTSLSYGNDFYSYENHGGTTTPSVVTPNPFAPFPPPGTKFSPIDPGQPGFTQMSGSGASLAGLLDRIEQSVGLDFNWTLSPETILFAGGSYAWANYTGGEPIAVLNYVPASDPGFEHTYVYHSSARDYGSYGGHVGVSHQLTGSISLSAVVGAAYTDNSNDPFNHQQVVSQTANVSVNYTYLPGSYVMLSVAQSHNATDVAQPGANNGITQYQDTTGVSLAWNHKITEKLLGSLIGQYSFSTYQGGATESVTDSSYDLGLNLSYQITRHFSTELGYNFDDLESGLTGRGYIRNRVYMGLSATF
ncbi:MAG: outer membrane beta-barrel protein [Verrucomicrobia bacterium]|nr:outer membrane beta-barrel protein [Verrucomicrobiota bacterium]